MKLQNLSIVSVLVLLFLISCSKKDSGINSIYKQPSNAHAMIVIPRGLEIQADNGNSNADTVIAFMNEANNINQFSVDFTVPDNAKTIVSNSDTIIYSWTSSLFSGWMTFMQFADKYTWTLDLQSSQISRFTYISAQELKSNQAGSWIINNTDGSNTVLWDYNYSFTGPICTTTINYYKTGGTISKFIHIDGGQNSGNFIYYEGSMKRAEVSWNLDGTGNWRIYSNGTDPITGSWTLTGK